MAKAASKATSSRGRICRSRRSSPAGVGTRMCVGLFPLPHLSNLVHTNPYGQGAEVEQCCEARYVTVDMSVEETPLGGSDDLIMIWAQRLGRTGGDGTTRHVLVLVIGSAERGT